MPGCATDFFVLIKRNIDEEFRFAAVQLLSLNKRSYYALSHLSNQSKASDCIFLSNL
jgi:hypothetical protein